MNRRPSGKGYKAAIALLNSVRRKARPETVRIASRITPDLKGTPNITGMSEWLRLLGITDSDLKKLNVIHVAGTKGKGSSCAFTSSLLQAYCARTGYPRRVGLYTSPHIRHVHERIRINLQPLAEDRFADYVFEVWNKISQHSSQKPRYLQLLMLVSVYSFLAENVDVAIYETHHGGEYDATNIFTQPTVTGITTIGMDHIQQLGPTIQNIAWHKSGIFKNGVAAFSTQQEPEVATILQQRAANTSAPLKFVGLDPRLPKGSHTLIPEVQKVNSSLALGLVDEFLNQTSKASDAELTFEDIKRGIDSFQWPGRFQCIREKRIRWYLDGAHNELSIGNAAQWFAEAISQPSLSSKCATIVIFSHISQRDGSAMLGCLAQALKNGNVTVSHLILSTYMERQDGSIREDHCLHDKGRSLLVEDQASYVDAWKDMDYQAEISFEPSIEGAMSLARKLGGQDTEKNVLITGSLYLIGGALFLLES